MNLAATLIPRLLTIGFAPRRAHRQGHSGAVVQPVQPVQRRLARHAILTLENRPLQLCVLRGWVWITRDGCLADRVLGVGDVFEQQPGEPVLVQALEDAELLLAAVRASA